MISIINKINDIYEKKKMGKIFIIIWGLLWVLLIAIGVGVGNSRFADIVKKYNYEGIPGNRIKIAFFDENVENQLRKIGATDDEIMSLKHYKNIELAGAIIAVLPIIYLILTNTTPTL